ncbi:ATP-binding protein [Archangium sp.]|uniref:ATP-binding protein n=1 Tax=Archangium sp. TaxID=1872627 RepID=UPI002D67FBA6|nr:ATP-binding protein [Archangium sp.]HYO58779.1 ATP-binding protein [Archangium sp.]
MVHTQWSEERPEVAGLASPSPMLWVGGGFPPRFRWVSPSLVQSLGHAPEAWKTRGFVHRLVHPEDLDRVQEAWRTVARTGEHRTLEFRAASAEGRFVRLAVELNAIEPSPDGAGELIGTVRVLSPALQTEHLQRTVGSEEDQVRNPMSCLCLELTGPTSTQADLRDTLDGLPGPTWMVGGDLSILWCSPAKQAHGAETLLCVAARASDPQAWASAHRRALTGETVGFDFATCGRTYRCQIGPVRGADGAIVAALGVATDVSDLDEVAQELTRTQRQHEDLIDTIDGIVWESDARFRFMFVSKQAERLLGYPLQQWTQEPDFWLKHLHPEDRDWAPTFCMKATRECRPHEFDYRMIAADGSIVWLRDIVTVVSEGGRPSKLRGIMVDITEQHRAQEHLEHTVSLLRATLDSTADGVMVVDQGRRITAFNGRFQELWDVPEELLALRDAEKVGEHVRSQLKYPEQALTRRPELLADSGKESIDTLELRDGRILERYSRPQRLGDTIVGRVWSYRDVTAERRAQAERERLLREAQEAIRVRDDFLSIASHELKTPLTPLKLHLQMLKKRMASGQPIPAQYAEKALAQVVRLSGLINDLLDTSRIQAGRLELKHEPVSLRELTQEVMADLRPVSPHHTLEYEEPGEALVIQGDRGRLAQVLVNLLENALKYSPTGGSIRVSVERDEAQVIVSVSDAGIGIPPDQKSLLFERFFRARNAPISGFGGLGLGLYICRDIVERHGGRIWVESEVGHGSTFRFTLPVVDGVADAHAPPA